MTQSNPLRAGLIGAGGKRGTGADVPARSSGQLAPTLFRKRCVTLFANAGFGFLSEAVAFYIDR
jgi:hypothetical protein